MEKLGDLCVLEIPRVHLRSPPRRHAAQFRLDWYLCFRAGDKVSVTLTPYSITGAKKIPLEQIGDENFAAIESREAKEPWKPQPYPLPVKITKACRQNRSVKISSFKQHAAIQGFKLTPNYEPFMTKVHCAISWQMTAPPKIWEMCQILATWQFALRDSFRYVTVLLFIKLSHTMLLL